MAQEPHTDAEQAVAKTVDNIKRLAHGIGAEFVPDPERVRAFTAGYPQAQERARAAVAQMRQRIAD